MGGWGGGDINPLPTNDDYSRHYAIALYRSMTIVVISIACTQVHISLQYNGGSPSWIIAFRNDSTSVLLAFQCGFRMQILEIIDSEYWLLKVNGNSISDYCGRQDD